MKITLIRNSKIGEPSCSKLTRRLNQLGFNINKVGEYTEDLYDTNILIRWGYTGFFPIDKNRVVINTKKSIKLGCNKMESRQVLQSGGVSVPKSFFAKEEALDNNTYPLVGRPHTHTQGKHFEVIENPADLIDSNSEYWSEFIPKQKEFRVYVFGDKAIGMVEKIPGNRNDLAWNSHRGAEFIDVDFLLYPEIVNEAIKATRAIGQFFSGVDIMVFNNRPYVLELNSSIALSNLNRVEIFARAFEGFFNLAK